MEPNGTQDGSPHSVDIEEFDRGSRVAKALFGQFIFPLPGSSCHERMQVLRRRRRFLHVSYGQ